MYGEVKAQDDRTRANEVSPDSSTIGLTWQSAEAYCARGVASRAWSLDGSIADFTEAIRLKPNWPKPYYKSRRAMRNEPNTTRLLPTIRNCSG